MSASPCPFCGCDLLPVLDGAGRVNAYSHPRAQPFDVDDCFYSGHCIGVGLIPKWNRRAGGVGLGMEVVDGHPVFNLAGKGRLASSQLRRAGHAIHVDLPRAGIH